MPLLALFAPVNPQFLTSSLTAATVMGCVRQQDRRHVDRVSNDHEQLDMNTKWVISEIEAQVWVQVQVDENALG